MIRKHCGAARDWGAGKWLRVFRPKKDLESQGVFTQRSWPNLFQMCLNKMWPSWNDENLNHNGSK